MIRSRPTSAWANRKRSRITAAGLRRRILHVLRVAGPSTREDLGRTLGVDGSSIRPRVLELIRAGKIRASGYGRTLAGNKAELLRVRRAPTNKETK